jgi:hypothetical protein
MTTEILIYAVICICGLILLMLCAGMITFGRLIANTPDGQEMRGERVRDENAKKSWSSPEKFPQALSYGFFMVFVIGSAVLVVSGGDTIMLIMGGITVFASVFFAAGTALFEMMMYNQMLANLKDQREYAKAIRA